MRRHRGLRDYRRGAGNVSGENNTPFKLRASLERPEFRVESGSYPAEYGTGTGGE
jgi:hypothetical protein